jgi:GDPmannose 4,6-dehydratase
MRALITGITGQDGSYLAEMLLEKKYEVYGLVRSSSQEKYGLIEHIRSQIKFFEGELTSQDSLDQVVKQVQADELYNFAAQSFVPLSWDRPILTSDITGFGVVRLLESIRAHSPKTRFLQASSSEMFGTVTESPQTEETCFHPRSPYGVAKVFGHHIIRNYREHYGIFACSSICYNHESPRRGSEFVTRKVSQHAARIKLGMTDKLKMGNLDARRDWGFAGDYVRAMWMMLQQTKADDFVIATGKTHSVQELLEVAFSCVGLDWKQFVEIDPAFLRPVETHQLRGNASKAERVLGWKPRVTFEQLIRMMVEADLALISNAPVAQTGRNAR